MAEIYSNQINMEGNAGYSTDRGGYVNPTGDYVQQLGKDLNTIGKEIQEISDKRAVAYMEQNSKDISDMLDRWDMTTQGGVKEMEAAAKKMYNDAISSLPMMTKGNFEVNNPYYKKTMDTLIKKKVREVGVKHVAKQFSNDMLQNAYNSYKSSKGNANVVLRNLTDQLNILANDPVLSMDPDEVDALQLKYGKEYLTTALDMMIYDGNYAGANALLGSKEAAAYLGGSTIARYGSSLKQLAESKGKGSGSGSGSSKESDVDALDKVFNSTVRANVLAGMSYEDSMMAAAQKMQKVAYAFEVGDAETMQALLGDDMAALIYFSSLDPVERARLGSNYGKKLQELSGVQQDVAEKLSAVNQTYGVIVDKAISDKSKDKGKIDRDDIEVADMVALRASIENTEGIRTTAEQRKEIKKASDFSKNFLGSVDAYFKTPIDSHYSQVATGWVNQSSTSIFSGYTELPVSATVGSTFFKDREQGKGSVFDGNVSQSEFERQSEITAREWESAGLLNDNGTLPDELDFKQATAAYTAVDNSSLARTIMSPTASGIAMAGRALKAKMGFSKGKVFDYMRSNGYFWDESNEKFVRDPNVFNEDLYKSSEIGIDILSEGFGYDKVPPVNSKAYFIFYMADRLKKLSDSPDCEEQRKELGLPAGFFSGEKAAAITTHVHDKHFYDDDFMDPIDTVRILNGAQTRPDGESIDLTNDRLIGIVKNITDEFVGPGVFSDNTVEAIAGSYRRIIKPAKSWSSTSHRSISKKSPVYKQAARAGYVETIPVRRPE